MTVYLLEIGGRVKIGYASNLKERLRSYPPHSRLLATRRGGKVTESHEHGQWRAHLAAGREWFYPAPELTRYIDQLDDPEPVEDQVEDGKPIRVGSDLGEVTRTLRERQGRTQADLAFWVGCSRESVVRFEHGNANITFDNLLSMIDSLGYELLIQKK